MAGTANAAPRGALTRIVERIARAGGDRDRVTVRDVMTAVGDRSFGPLLLVPGLIVLSPIGGIPGVPTVGAVIIVLVAAQVVLGLRHVWLPKVILDRSVDAKRLGKALDAFKPVARVTDRYVGRRLTVLTRGAANKAVGLACILIALMMPPMEILPFANALPSSAIAVFGLAITARDGALTAIAFLLTAAAFYLVLSTFLF